MASTIAVDLDNRPPVSFYLSVGLVAGSIIALRSTGCSEMHAAPKYALLKRTRGALHAALCGAGASSSGCTGSAAAAANDVSAVDKALLPAERTSHAA